MFILKDYNKENDTNFHMDSLDWFEAYRANIANKVKEGWQIDVFIVVNMFLTWFDSKYLNNSHSYGIKIRGVVVNRYKKKAPLKNEQIENLMGIPIISTIPEDSNVEKSIKYNVPVVHLEPFSKSAISFKSSFTSWMSLSLIGLTSQKYISSTSYYLLVGKF